MRPITRSDKFDASGNPVEYNPWGEAKRELVAEIGSYCSFCCKKLTRSALHVEHIYAKNYEDSSGAKIYDYRKYHWNNFLLGCVNCNSVKGSKDIASRNPFMPHEDNPLHFVDVGSGGLITQKNPLPSDESARIQAYFDLVGIDRRPGHSKYSHKDDRWEYRMKAYDLAMRYHTKYNSGEADIETIVELATSQGFFAVWYTVFKAFNDIIEALINGFTGTNRAKFDSDFNTVA